MSAYHWGPQRPGPGISGFPLTRGELGVIQASYWQAKGMWVQAIISWCIPFLILNHIPSKSLFFNTIKGSRVLEFMVVDHRIFQNIVFLFIYYIIVYFCANIVWAEDEDAENWISLILSSEEKGYNFRRWR